jgi:hypothetical protein
MSDNEFHILLVLLEEHTRAVLGVAEQRAPLQRVRAASNSGASSKIGANPEESAALYDPQSAICNGTRGPRG